MKFYAKGKEITEKEFNRINEQNTEIFRQFERTGNMALLHDIIFLTQIKENKK